MPNTLIDLFSGAGGLSQGLSDAGFKSLYANELKAPHAATYAQNHPDSLVDQRDIREVCAKSIRTKLGLAKGELSLIAGGPPCQGFSINAPTRSAEDERNHLFREYLRFVEEFEPQAVLIENVPGLVSFENGETLAAILESLEELWYAADVRILYAPHYGIPQTRWRTVVIGLKDGTPSDAYPTPSHEAPIRVNFTSHFGGRNIVSLPCSAELPQHITVKDALDDLPEISIGEKYSGTLDYKLPAQNDFQRLMRTGSSGVLNHAPPVLGKVNIERAKLIPPGGNWTDLPFEMLPKGMQRARRSDHTKRYGRVHPEGLASTILTKCDPHWGAYFHYSQDRTFTVREAARIQTFPDRYEFTGSKSEQYEQVGNAVPPLLAFALGKELLRLVKDVSTHPTSDISQLEIDL